jgi:serine/threonine-protein kinase
VEALAVDTDRNLLFGVLALQADLLDNEQFAEACSAWAARKETPLADQLVERGWLTADARAHLDFLLACKLKKHQDDAHASLAAVADPGVRRALSTVHDADVEQSLASLPAAAGPATDLPTQDVPAAAAGRYRVLRAHAKGGLGEVFVALDTELHREVALKEIQAHYAGHAASRSRFLLEAEITGGLEHPGIVPVYGLNAYPDGRPYYAMRLIQGDSLKEALTRFHRAPNFRGAAFRQLLRRFVDVCNAVAYAHSRGVLHRDLKPANVMLGPFGETLVVDWGLAKVVGRDRTGADAAAEATLQPTSASSQVETVAGTALGTPAYMSPEQAAGRLEELGPASDVYSLGATLYALLTGHGPIEGTDAADALRRVQRGDWAPPRQLQPAIPVVLDAVCRKALALRAAERYATPLALAADVDRWLADEPVSAYRDPLTVRLARGARRHRTLVAGAAAAVLVAVVTLTAATGLLAAANRREQAERTKANANFQLAVQAVGRYYTQVSDSPELKEHGLEKLRTRLLETAAEFYEKLVQEEGSDRALHSEQAAAHWRLGQLYQDTGRHREAEATFRQGLTLREQLAAAADDPDAHSAVAEMHHRLGWLYQNTGRVAEAEAELKQALAILEPLVADHPAAAAYQGYLAANYNDLGILYKRTDRAAEARTAHEKALALRERLVQAHPDVLAYQEGVAESQGNLGSLHWAQHQLPLAGAAWQADLRIHQELVRQQPTNLAYQRDLASCQYNLGFFYDDSGQSALAEQHWREALTAREKLAREHPAVLHFQKDLAESCNMLAGVYKGTQRFEQSTALFRQALDIWERLTRQHPEVPEFLTERGGVCCNLGMNQADQGNAQQALDWFGRARTALEDVLKRDARNVEAQQYLFITSYHQAQALTGLKRHAEAVAVWDWAERVITGSYRPQVRSSRAATLARAGDYKQATAQADEVARSDKLPGPSLYGLARAYALSAAAVKQDTQLLAADSDRRAEQYAACAVQMLTRAKTVGYLRNTGHLKSDEELAVLRQRPDFQQFLAEVDAKAAAK